MDRLDPLDDRLVRALGKDAWQSSEALARQFSVSPATIRRRIRRLRKSGLVRVVAVAEPAGLGYPLSVMIALDVAREKLSAVLKMLADRREVRWVATTTGRFDILALAQFSSTGALSDFLQKDLAKAEGIRDSETFICLQVEKGAHMPIG